MSSSRKRIALVLGFGIATSGLGAAPVAADAAGTGLVISEAYGGGGNSGSTYTHDFIELYNPTTSAISVNGWSVQYRSAGGTATGAVTNLSGSVPAKGYYLVQEAMGSGGTTALPTPDATGTISMSGTGFQVWLSNGTAALTPPAQNVANVAGIIDFVGASSTATSYETAFAPAPSNTNAITRSASGADSDKNNLDFTAAAPAPQNTSWTAAPPPPPPTPAGARTIAEIQGDNTDVSPFAGQTVTTTGVVTASFPTGGFKGFYLQTGGTPATPDASDGIFVYGPGLAAEQFPTIGASLEVFGTVSEFGNLTQITASASGITSIPALAPPVPLTSVPGTECALPGTSCLTGAALDAAREKHEGELIQPTDRYTVTDAYDGSAYDGGANNTQMYGEIGLAANSHQPLVAPTEVIDAQATTQIADRRSYNNAHRVILDDGSSTNYASAANTGLAFPYFTADHVVRVGADVSFPAPVVLDYRFGWKLQPQSQVVGAPTGKITFAQDRPALPEDVGGDVTLATFNVLNYFPTTGEEFVGMGGGRTCTYYTDRAANRITTNSCNPNGPRGAANTTNLTRQQDKIIDAINKLDADVVSLEEIENSVQFGKDRDFAVGVLVDALNAAAGAGTWAFAPSPAAADLPDLAEQDVIRMAFIYKPATIDLVGASKVLVGEAAFNNAREPVAQVFKPRGTGNAKSFAVIANHFKSKGSGTPDPFGQGNATDSRIQQAKALVRFADDFKAERKLEKVFLTGDFNAYSMEDPIQELEAAGYTSLESTSNPEEETYNFDGQVGSLDHVFANAAALPTVAGVDVWTINGAESVYYEYSRHNYNVTNLFAVNPFRSSDHSPEIVGINLGGTSATEEVQILATNDFHGRLLNNTGNGEAGAAVLAGAVKQLRAQNPQTVFAAAGDLIGASTFESFIQRDKPTIDALNEAGLDVSAVGNHEFDAGYDDLINRVMAKYDKDTNPEGGATWKYIGANVRLKATGNHAVPASWIRDFGDVQVGFIGAVTEDLPSLVSPAGIADLAVTDIVTESNAAAADLEAEGADVIVLLVHEGAASTALSAATDASAFGRIVTGVNAKIDAIVSGHTHLAYNHAIEVPQWAAEGRAVTQRPVVSAGQYGTLLNQLKFTVNSSSGEVVGLSQGLLNLKSGQTALYPVDAATKSIVDKAVTAAETLGARELGRISGAFNRAKLADGTTENRGGESTLGNLVAEVQRWATETPSAGSAQIAFMNPGGLRADMTGTAGGYPAVLTYKQAAVVQPFANTLINMKLTGANLKTVLEQQWQRDGAGNIPSRPFLRLGASRGFTYTYDSAKPEGSRITGMWLDGVSIDPAVSYSVTVNSFLATGGDNFRAFTSGTQKRDTGKIDLQAMVDYLAAKASTTPLPIGYTQQAVGVSFPSGAPASYVPARDDVRFNLSSLAFANGTDLKDTEVRVSLDGVPLGTFAVDNTIGSTPNDEYGTSAVSVRIPAGTPAGAAALTVTGLTTGTTFPVRVVVAQPLATSISATATPMSYGTDGSVDITVTADGTPAGTVTVLDGVTELGSARLTGGSATVAIGGTALDPGTHDLVVRFTGDAGFADSVGTVRVEVAKAASQVAATITPGSVVVHEGIASVDVTVTSAPGVVPTGAVTAYVDGTSVGDTVLDGGTATIRVGPFTTVGSRSIRVEYAGSDQVAGSRATTSVEVVKAPSQVSISVPSGDIVAGRTKVKLTIRVSAQNTTPTGVVKVTAEGVTYTRTLKNGVAVITMTAFKTPGQKTVVATYSGDATVAGSSRSIDLTVKAGRTK
ncbi:MAG: ExeM/NucH family extracellular endonuclease [Pedococcus sp.]